MVSWLLSKAAALKKDFEDTGLKETLSQLEISGHQLNDWQKIKTKLTLNIDDNGIIEHFKGYFGLKELDWNAYREKYEDIHRLDRILKAEGKSPDAYKLSKQAGLMMVFYNLGNKEVSELIKDMAYEVPENYIKRNFEYYIQRTSHGSTLSRLVYARLAFQVGMYEKGWELYTEALASDLNDIQGGTTGEGIHCGVMAGTVYDTLVSFAGLDLSGENPQISPALPEYWKSLKFKFSFRGKRYQLNISATKIELMLTGPEKLKIKVHICGNEYEVETGKLLEVNKN